MTSRVWLASAALAAIATALPAAAQNAAPAAATPALTAPATATPETKAKPRTAKPLGANRSAKGKPSADTSASAVPGKPASTPRTASTAPPALAVPPSVAVPKAAAPKDGPPKDAALALPSEEKPATRRARRTKRESAKAAQEAAATPAPSAPAPSGLFSLFTNPGSTGTEGGSYATNPVQTLFGAAPAQQRGDRLPSLHSRSQIDALVAQHARLNNVPEALVHRIIVRESKYNPRAVGRGGAMGLMQIKTPTARGLGYTGGPAGLLDAETNITYAVKYLAGAWRVSGGSHDRAVMHYARGYYYEAKRLGQAGPSARGSRRRGGQPEAPAMTAAPEKPASLFSLFNP